jgi:hypothetical protein
MEPSMLERFNAKWTGEPNSGCWLWLAGLNRTGYGQFYAYKALGTNLAHRVAWLLLRGPVPDGLQLDHKCRVRSCVNPDHLELVTASENARRGIGPALSRARFATATHCAKGHELTPENIYRSVRDGSWRCRLCMLKRAAEQRARKLLGGAINDRSNRAKTHCKHGHPFQGDNVIVRKTRSGRGRQCRTCINNQARSYYKLKYIAGKRRD